LGEGEEGVPAALDSKRGNFATKQLHQNNCEVEELQVGTLQLFVMFCLGNCEKTVEWRMDAMSTVATVLKPF